MACRLLQHPRPNGGLAKADNAASGLIQDVKFDNILPALQSKKYDISLSSFTDNKQREQSFDFVTYFSAGTGLMVKTGTRTRAQLTALAVSGEPPARNR